MSLTTIDLTINADLFRDVDPIGLLRDASARSYQIELRKRLKEEFPNANVFLKWNPNRTGPTDVFTLPEHEAARARVLEIAKQVERDKDLWVSYDQSVRAAL
ncbi:MAG TPA: hypothetical protein VIL20_30820 [Sandaracinaceae bacterium]